MAMGRTWSIAGWVGLLAPLIWVLAAGGAAAEQRVVICAEGGKQFGDPHCTKAGTGFGHVAVPEGEAIKTTISNQKTASETTAAAPMKLKTTVGGGFEGLFECSTVTGSGSLTNGAKAVKGTVEMEFSGCAVVKPAGFGCVIEKGRIATSPLVVTTEGQAINRIKFAAETAETKIATVNIESCSFAPTNGKFGLTGNFTASISGATVTLAHEDITAQESLKYVGGHPAGFEGALTFRKEGGYAVSFT